MPPAVLTTGETALREVVMEPASQGGADTRFSRLHGTGCTGKRARRENACVCVGGGVGAATFPRGNLDLGD